MHIIGVDVSKKKLHCAYLKEPASEKLKIKAAANSREGVEALLSWTRRHTQAEPEAMHFVMEATGVYHEAVAEALVAAGATVSVVNPKHVRHFAESRGIVSKTDAHDRRVLALFGHERRPEAWQPPPAHAKQLRALLDRLDVLDADIRRESNRREKAEFQGNDDVLRSHQTVIGALERERDRLHQEIDQHIDRHPDLRDKRRLLASIPGIGEQLSRHLAALFASERFRSASQAAAYLGLTPKQHESGTSVRSRPRLSKTGPARLRAKLYLPAASARRWNHHIEVLAQRLERAGKTPMAIIGAIMRKLIHIAFGVIKHQQPYDPAMA